uniref:Histone RNA hairpin-binding protein RNA-binding domain-containing protein n=1 Tax=Attheya septentrionalis TaxID=420275 RepID=A0A7S2U6X7_9STRA|mmetsp:Transcript_12972/g.23498  ORF Transcript_12972/g.23498 Transcript_12972/m.23498 type:complete len:290 (+) Transcript_12972:30-899(+)|eukprot:CAMPEP_0198296226 /NCGR_PEP_ID=MMETSP1449-20131203/31562_1 /TAXON_ID=420275 /ORGANISM="Attheya septentrionalis, Strain CCMP2084" /LENGTH=289 /DNA_ID=CAMNT_0043996783 /DNA_START=23 /DNA_END=892 /DNA_ORIENTATION=+
MKRYHSDSSRPRPRHRLSPPPQRRNEDNKRRKIDQSTGPAPNASAMLLDGQPIPQLDPGDPVHARRVHQRRKMVQKGKNTVGYDEYIRQVPLHQRRPRCPDHPMTPDFKADIPNRRWLGLVSSWRKGLHKYDPADLMNAGNQTSESQEIDKPSPAAAASTPQVSTGGAWSQVVSPEDQRKTNDATRPGLQVEFSNESLKRGEVVSLSSGPGSVGGESNSSMDARCPSEQFDEAADTMNEDDDVSQFMLETSEDYQEHQPMDDEMKRWEASQKAEQDFLSDGDDSDDDLL